MIKFFKSLFGDRNDNKFPAPETPKPNVIPHGQGTPSFMFSELGKPVDHKWLTQVNSTKKESKEETINSLKLLYPNNNDDQIQKLYDALTSDYWSEPSTKKLPKRDSKGRFSK